MRAGPSSASHSHRDGSASGSTALDRISAGPLCRFPQVGATDEPPLRPRTIKLREPDAGGWSIVPASRASARRVRSIGRSRPSLASSRDRSCSSHSTIGATRRSWPRAGSGRRTSLREPLPDQVAIAYGSDPARELVWTWRTAPTVERRAIRILPARFESAETSPHSEPDLTGMQAGRGTSTLVRSPNLLNDPRDPAPFGHGRTA